MVRISFTLWHSNFSLFRVFSLLDGTCSKLDPNFSYINALDPYNQELLRDINFIDFLISSRAF